VGQTNINISIDEDLKEKAEYLFSEFGMNMSTAFTIFVKTVIRQGKIPFEISIVDDFYNPYNQEFLRKTIANKDHNEPVIKSIEELESMTNE